VKSVLLLIPALATLASCASPQQPDLSVEQSTLMETSRAWARAVAAGDVEQIVGYWSDDAIVLAPDQPAIVGKAAIRDFVKQMQAIPQFNITWDPERATVAASGGMGYLVEHTRTTLADASGKPITQYGKAVTIWRKDAGGAWKCVVDTWNNNPTERVLPNG